jgi:hypothetical protein
MTETTQWMTLSKAYKFGTPIMFAMAELMACATLFEGWHRSNFPTNIGALALPFMAVLPYAFGHKATALLNRSHTTEAQAQTEIASYISMAVFWSYSLFVLSLSALNVMRISGA